MVFAILFVVAFLIGLVIYFFSRQWLAAVIISMILFTVATVADTQASDQWLITLVFGLPIVFFASLLGAYVVQLKTGGIDDEQEGEADDPTHSDNVDQERANGVDENV